MELGVFGAIKYHSMHIGTLKEDLNFSERSDTTSGNF